MTNKVYVDAYMTVKMRGKLTDATLESQEPTEAFFALLELLENKANEYDFSFEFEISDIEVY